MPPKSQLLILGNPRDNKYFIYKPPHPLFRVGSDSKDVTSKTKATLTDPRAAAETREDTD